MNERPVAEEAVAVRERERVDSASRSAAESDES
jgi:hypothetical protein